MAPELEQLTSADLRRTVLSRQLLTVRRPLDIATAVSQVASLRAQNAPTMYVGMWSRLAEFQRDDLTDALEARRVVQGTMMRSTIHLCASGDYWPLNLAVREHRRTWYLRTHDRREAEVLAAARRTRAAFADTDVLTRRELDEIAAPVGSSIGLFTDLVRVPPSGTWERRRADRYALAEQWVGPQPDMSVEEAWRHLVRHYLTGFGPASPRDLAGWAGVNGRVVDAALAAMTLTRVRSPDGAVLVDLPELSIAPPTTPLPPRLLGPWEALLLVHARRAEIIAEEDRPRIFGVRTPQSFGTFMVDGTVQGTWRHHDGDVELTPWRPLGRSARAALEAERDGLATLHG